MPKLIVLIFLALLFYPRPPVSLNQPRNELKALTKQANALMRTGDLPAAEALFRQGLVEARQKADWTYVSGFLTSLGVVRVNESRYRQALDFLRASTNPWRKSASAAGRSPVRSRTFACLASAFSSGRGWLRDTGGRG